MTTGEDTAQGEFDRLNANVAKVEALSHRLITALAHKRPIEPQLQGPGQDLFLKTATAYMAEVMSNPARIIEHQVTYWGTTLKHYAELQKSLSSGQFTLPDAEPGDKRFADPLWRTHPYFNYLRQQYLLTSEVIERALTDLDHLEERDRRRLQYFSRQILELLSPANFLSTNPEALSKAVETEGQSLVDGLENLVRDVEANEGEVLVSLADRDAFKVGESLAMTPGKVVYRNRLFELIQYAPKTETVHETPLVIFPPWINKFYILDLREKNSLVRWVVDQGYTLFVVSWADPDASYADVGLDTYVEEGILKAIEEVRSIAGVAKVNAVGYCIGGTMLAATLSLMRQRGNVPVRSASFFTTLTDFKDQGDFTPFMDEGFVDGIEREVADKGYLHSFFMARTFSFLRARDLVYGPAVRSYMMGEAPPAFDLLYWNGDSTNLPGRMVVEYLRWLCQEDRLARGELELLGHRLSLKDIKLPVCAIACESDHIAAWKTSFNGIKQFASRSKTFILSESGHIAGIVNPPSRVKYGHYVGGSTFATPEDWLADAVYHEGSWWPRWEGWLKTRAGKQVPARDPGDADHPPLADAPGVYVKATGDR